MEQIFVDSLISLGFERKLETLYCLVIDDELFATKSKWLAFAYYEDGNYYFSNNGDLVEEFDAPNIVLEIMLDEIRKKIFEFGCVLNVSNIVKKIDLNNIEDDYNQFLLAVKAVDNLYKNL